MDRRAFFSPPGPAHRTTPSAGRRADLTPYVPSAAMPWDARRARHLVRRTHFGATVEDVAAVLAATPEEAVDRIIDEARIAPLPTPPPWLELVPPTMFVYSPGYELFVQSNGITFLLNARWLQEMYSTGLRERMALFWHNHFVTGLSKYLFPWFAYRYLTTLRTHGLANFKTFTHAIGLEPAMLLYLDGGFNKKTQPNENYARELLELFTTGIGHYTQQDVTELARALSGWLVSEVRQDKVFVALHHDEGEKTLFGHTGAYDYDGAIDLLFEARREAIARHICRKLYAEFVYPTPDDAIVDAMAATFLEADFEIAPVLRQLLKSTHFFSDTVIGARVKSPVELMLGLLREAGLEIEPPLDPLNPSNTFILLNHTISDMGQVLFDPPNVAGWPGGRSWVSTATLPNRWRVADRTLQGHWQGGTFNPIELAERMGVLETARGLVRYLADHFLPVPPSTASEDKLRSLMLGGLPEHEWDTFTVEGALRALALTRALVQLPEYQLT